MNKKGTGITKKTIALAAVLVSVLLGLLTLLFIQGVQTQLWQQSVNNILESTQQGCNTLKIQLRDEYLSLGTITSYVKSLSANQTQALEEILSSYTRTDPGVTLYLPDGTSMPFGSQQDQAVGQALQDTSGRSGLIDPHISSVTGVNVFNLFVKVTLQDGTESYLVKEYEVDNIVDSFSLSFYHDAGFSYVIDAGGDVLIRSPHPNSNKTIKNLFDMLSEPENNPESLSELRQALETSQTGWAVFRYQGEETVFCYTPLKLSSDWHLISIIPKAVVSAQTNDILVRSLLLILSIILGIVLLVVFYLRYMKRANRRLKSQADYIGHLYNAVPEGIALITVEFPPRFIQLNQEGLRLLHYPEDASNDAPDGTLLQDVIHPDDYEEFEALFRSAVQNGGKTVFEFRMLTADQTFFWAAGIVEKTLDETGMPVLITAFHDITDSKLAQEAEEREKLQERLTLVGAISNAYPVIVRLNLTQDALSFIYVKEGLLLGLGEQTSYSGLYEGMISTIHPDQLEEFEHRFSPEHLTRTLGWEKNEIFLEAKQKLTDGNYHWTSTQIIYVDNPYSDDQLAILLSRRIDEQRHEEEQRRQALQIALDSARAASEAKGRFLSNMSHDIRTPMNAIVGMTAIATTHLDDRDRVLECLKKISLSSKHLLSLINDVLEMSKIESGKLSLREEPFNLAELVADAVELVRPQAKARELQLDIRLAPLKNEQAIGDSLRVRQVCINILSNAVKYTLPGGNIQVEVWQEPSSRRGYQNYLFRCADTGAGMSEEFLEKLFQPFERAQNSTTSKTVGTGLGMAITKNVIDLMNGDIQVESEPGKGSVFTVTFPLRLQDAEQEEIPKNWVGIRTLIVDDDQPACENAAQLLESLGLRAEYATDGQTAVTRILQAHQTPEEYHLVVLDWRMPDLDGVEVTRRIRKEIGPELPVIVLTAYDWSEIETEAKEAGVTAFLSKPFYRSKICYLLSELSGEPDQSIPQKPAEKSKYTGKRILLVEDNEINREIARLLIQEMGVQICEACDGEEAVKQVAESPEAYFDLILMDIQMPRMDGYEATKAIRNLNRQDVKEMPIIAMTANAFDEDVRAALRAGMNAHFAKPIDVKVLEDILSSFLSS